MQHFQDRDGVSLDVGAVFDDPAFAALKDRGAAFAVVRPHAADVVWANEAAAAYWGAADADELAVALFGPEVHGGWLDGIVRGVVPGRAPRFARGGLTRGLLMKAHTALLHAVTAPDGSVILGVAVPDSAGPETGDAAAWLRPAWAPEPACVPAPERDGGLAAETPDRPVPDSDAGASLARRSQIAVLRDRLSHAVDGAVTLRLLWRTDAADAVTQIDGASFARLGSPLRFDGGTLPGAVAGFDPTGAARLGAALATRATWSGVTLDLPVADAVAVVPMALSASPVFGPDRSFAGFRGFCTLDLGRLDLAPPRAAVPDAVETVEAVALADASPELALPGTDAPAVPDTGAPLPAEDPVPAAPANVVHLRAFQAMASGRFAAAVPPVPSVPVEAVAPVPATADEAVEPAPDAPLSDDMAFLALGEALRARIGAEPRAATPADVPVPQEADPVAVLVAPLAEPSSIALVAPPVPSVAFAEPLLDQLPMALLALAGPVPVFANAAAAARLGYATPAAVLAMGSALVASPPHGDALALRDARGQILAMTARSAAVSLSGAPATLWIFGEPQADVSDPPPPPAARSEEVEPGAGELLDRVDDAVALLDGNGRIRRLNRRGEGWFGREGALGQGFTHLLAPESRPAGLTLLGEVRNQRDGLGAPPLAREVMARTGDAGPVPMLLTLGRLGDSGFYATLRDVTALRRAETERARSERDHARDAGRLPDLLAKVSHEVRTPLNAILGFAEVMMDERFGPLGNPRYRDYLKDIHASGTQVVTLIEDLLDLSRIEAGQLDLDVGAVDVNRIVAETVAQMQPEAHRERVIMRTSLGGRIPSVLADERSARQIVRNLLSNAVKFNEPGGQVIVSTALSDSGTVVLRVRDTGVGMTDAEIAAALEPFGGLASPHPANGNGNGLGLPLTRALVGANGASMAIRSRPREGTLVEVAFASAGAEDARLPA